MAKRSTSRRIAMQALYQADISKSYDTGIVFDVCSDRPYKQDTIDFALKLFTATVDNMTTIDKQINAASKGWPVSRMSAVDRNILRIAVCESDYIKENPFAVIADEAVELAKKYAGETASVFINGVLSAFAPKTQ